jgi:Sap-like sulfolipid-1-addressing protein
LDNDLVRVFVAAAVATLNPSLLAAVTVMLLLPRPKRLMLGYLLGAYTTSLAFGLTVVFSLHGSGALRTSKRTLSPVADILIGVVALAIALVLATDRDARVRRWRSRRKERKAKRSSGREPWQQRMLGKGSARITFLVGALLSFPGVSYVGALDHIVALNPGTVFGILLVVFFCVMQQLLLELPLLGYVFAPGWTPGAVSRSRVWLHHRGRRIATVVLAALGLFLIARGAVTFTG